MEIKQFFSELSYENQKTLLKNGIEQKARAGTILFYEGDKPNHLYLVRSGKVKISKVSFEGKELSIRLKQKDELVGEVGLFNDMPLSVTAEVIEDASLVVFKKYVFEEIFYQSGEVAVAFMKWFSRNTQSNQIKFSDLIVNKKTEALYSILIRFSNSFGSKKGDGSICINVQLTNQDVANYMGASREIVNRIMNDLKKREVITYNQGYIIIKDIIFLKQYLKCEDCPVHIYTI